MEENKLLNGKDIPVAWQLCCLNPRLHAALVHEISSGQQVPEKIYLEIVNMVDAAKVHSVYEGYTCLKWICKDLQKARVQGPLKSYQHSRSDSQDQPCQPVDCAQGGEQKWSEGEMRVTRVARNMQSYPEERHWITLNKQRRWKFANYPIVVAIMHLCRWQQGMCWFEVKSCYLEKVFTFSTMKL